MERRASFGYWMRRRRKALDLTQHELAQRVGCAVGTIQKLEGDERRPSKQLAERLADLLLIPAQERNTFLKVARADLATDQLEIDERASEISPQHTLAHPKTNLPFPATPLIGREREVAALRDLIGRDDVRLVTLTGPGGAGKTRLSLQVAADVLDLFEHGVWFVNLAPISALELVASAIGQALGVREIGGQPVLELVKPYLREKRMLLLLDNFEQAVEAAPLISELLAFAPGLKVLVTSRTTLRLSGEHEFAVPPLGLPPRPPQPPTPSPTMGGRRVFSPPLSTIKGKGVFSPPLPAWERGLGGEGDLTQYEAVRLFIERAQAVKADFMVTNENAPAVAEICYRLEGLPLAIELAAARVKLFPPQALLERLGSRLGFLTGGARDLPARQQTIRNTIDWSYHLLGEREKTLFARLGAFVGGCTLEAAEVVASELRIENEELRKDVSEDDIHNSQFTILNLLASLVDQNLLKRVEGVHGEPRLVMLETIREYAQERLAASGEVGAIRRRHAGYYLALAEKSREEDHGDTEVALFDRFEQDLDNLRAALDWSHAAESTAEIEVRLAAALVQFWVVRGYASEGWERLKSALTRRDQVSAAVRARALGYVALFPSHFAGELDQAVPFIDEGLALHQMLGDTEGVAWLLMQLGLVAAYQGDYLRSTQLNEQSLALYQALDDTWGMSCQHFQLGELALLQGDLERANVLLERSLTLCRQSTGATWAIARRTTWLGAVVLAQGDAARASALFAESLSLCVDSRDKVDIPMALVGLAGVARAQGQLERAVRLLGAAESLSDSSGSYRGLSGSLIMERTIAATRAQLDVATFEAAWAAGRALTLAQAIEAALGNGIIDR